MKKYITKNNTENDENGIQNNAGDQSVLPRLR